MSHADITVTEWRSEPERFSWVFTFFIKFPDKRFFRNGERELIASSRDLF